jgi:hypothetical protein
MILPGPRNVGVDVSVSFSAYTDIGAIRSRQISCAVITSQAGMPPAHIRELRTSQAAGIAGIRAFLAGNFDGEPNQRLKNARIVFGYFAQNSFKHPSTPRAN